MKCTLRLRLMRLRLWVDATTKIEVESLKQIPKSAEYEEPEEEMEEEENA